MRTLTQKPELINRAILSLELAEMMDHFEQKRSWDGLSHIGDLLYDHSEVKDYIKVSIQQDGSVWKTKVCEWFFKNLVALYTQKMGRLGVETGETEIQALEEKLDLSIVALKAQGSDNPTYTEEPKYGRSVQIEGSGFSYLELSFLRSIGAVDLVGTNPSKPSELRFLLSTTDVLKAHCFSQRPRSTVEDLGGEACVAPLMERFLAYREDQDEKPEIVIVVLNPFTRHWSSISHGEGAMEFNFSRFYTDV